MEESFPDDHELAAVVVVVDYSCQDENASEDACCLVYWLQKNTLDMPGSADADLLG